MGKATFMYCSRHRHSKISHFDLGRLKSGEREEEVQGYNVYGSLKVNMLSFYKQNDRKSMTKCTFYDRDSKK